MDDERPQRRSWREGAATRVTVATVVRQVDLAATGTFAVEGAIAGVKDHLDIFGVIVIACVTAFGGGMVRDVLIGDVPPAAVRDRLYIPLALVAGFVVFLLYKPVENIPTWLFNGLDAVGLSLFAVAGSQKSLDFGLNDVSSAFLGVLTAVGGGTIAAVLLGAVPAVLRVDIYAVAALLGGVIVVAGSRLGWRRGPTMLAGALCCFALRVLSLWQHWNLPHHRAEQPGSAPAHPAMARPFRTRATGGLSWITETTTPTGRWCQWQPGPAVQSISEGLHDASRTGSRTKTPGRARQR